MARQQDSCWRCGDQWVIADDAATVAPREASRDDDGAQAARWTDEGGSWAGRTLVAGRH
jgi:hypothetical protein